MAYFWKQARLSFRLQATYRVAWVAGLATNIFFGFLRASVLLALYNGKAEVNGLSMTGALTYVALTQAMIAFLSIFGSFEIMTSVYNGMIASDLLKPVSFFSYWMARDLGKALMNLITRGLFLIALFALFFPIVLPSSIPHFLLILLSFFLAWFISFCYSFIVNLIAFWSTDGRGLGRLAFSLPQFLSGFFMPLRLLPDWFSQIVAYSPFPSLINTPVEVYMGILQGPVLLNSILTQVLWAIILFVLAQIIYRKGIQRLIIQGG